MTKRRKVRRRRTPSTDFRGVADFDAVGLQNRTTGAIDWYDKNVHITRSIDIRISSKSARFAAMSQKQRYKIIHSALGVQGIFDIVAFENRWIR